MKVLHLILLVACRLYVYVCPGLQLSGDIKMLANLGYLRDAFAPMRGAPRSHLTDRCSGMGSKTQSYNVSEEIHPGALLEEYCP